MVKNLFPPAVVQQIPVLHTGLAAAIQACQANLQTGIIELSLPPAYPTFDLLFVRGQMVNAYRRSEATERIPVENSLSLVPAFEGQGLLRALALTPQAIRLVKILLEQIGAAPASSLPTSQLEAQIEAWTAQPDPSLVHICWPGAEALALFPGASHLPRHTLFVAADQILHSAGGMMAFFGWKEQTCEATFYSSSSQTQAWQEYLLHSSFAWIIGHLLSHFEELTGRLLLDGMIHETNFTAAARGWNVNLAPACVTDQMIFGSAAEAVNVYRQLLDLILKYMASILGTDVLKLLVQESVMRLQPAYRRAFQDNFDFFEPVGAWPATVDQNA
jgi:hypothetical protein